MELSQKLQQLNDSGEKPTMANLGLSMGNRDRFELASTLQRIGADMMKAVDDVGMVYLVSFFPQLRGMSRELAHDWLKRKKVLYSPFKQEKAIEGGSVLWFAVISQKYKIRRCFEIRCQVISDITKPGKVALKVAHKECNVPEELMILEKRLEGETK